MANLNAFDLFHQKVKLSIRNSDRFTTSAGSILTLIVIIITIFQSLSTLQDIFNHQSPIITTERAVLADPGHLALNSSNFVFAVRVQDYGFNLSSAYASINVTLWSYILHPNGTMNRFVTFVPLKKCSIEYMKGFEKEFVKQSIDHALCPTIMEYDITGTYNVDRFDFIQVQVRTCTNSSLQPDIVCKPKEESEAILKELTVGVQLFFSNSIITPTNYTDPVEYYMSQHYWYTRPGKQTIETDLFLTQQDIITDDNVFFAGWGKQTLTTYQLDLTEERPQTIGVEYLDDDEGSYSFINIYMRKSHFLYTTKRVFPKLQQGLATIGGIFSLTVGFFGALAILYTNRIYALQIANELYEFDLPCETQKDQKRRKCCRKRTSHKISSLNDSSLKLNDELGDKNEVGKSIYMERFSKYAQGSQRRLNYTFWDFLLSFVPFLKRTKEAFLKKAMTMVGRDIDILQIVRQLQDVDRLKKILLDQDQLTVFSYSRPPLVTINEGSESSQLTVGSKTQLDQYSNIRENESPKQSPVKKKKANRVLGPFKDQRKNQIFEANQHYNSVYQFARLFDSYRKLIKNNDRLPVNLKILKMIDPEMHETLFNLQLEIKMNSEAAREYYKMIGMKAFEDLLFKIRLKRQEKMSRLEASLVIANRIKEFLKKKRASKQQQQQKAPQPSEIQSPIRINLKDGESIQDQMRFAQNSTEMAGSPFEIKLQPQKCNTLQDSSTHLKKLPKINNNVGMLPPLIVKNQKRLASESSTLKNPPLPGTVKTKFRMAGDEIFSSSEKGKDFTEWYGIL